MQSSLRVVEVTSEVVGPPTKELAWESDVVGLGIWGLPALQTHVDICGFGVLQSQ